MSSPVKPMQRVLVCCNGRTDALCEALPDPSWDVVGCPTCETMLEEALQRPPDLVLFRQNAHAVASSATLRLLRRIARGAPLVVLTESTSLEVLRLAQEFRPVFFVLEPSEPAELREVVRTVLASRTHKGKPSGAIPGRGSGPWVRRGPPWS